MIGVKVGNTNLREIAAVGCGIDQYRQDAVAASLFANGILPLPVKRAGAAGAAGGYLMAQVGELEDLRGVKIDDRRHDSIGHRDRACAGVGGDGDVRAGAIATAGDIREHGASRKQNARAKKS